MEIITQKRYIPPSRPYHAEPIDYGGIHPFELHAKMKQNQKHKDDAQKSNTHFLKTTPLRRRENEINSPETNYYTKPTSAQEYESFHELFQPIRVYFETSSLEHTLQTTKDQDKLIETKLRLILHQVLPKLSQIWKETLKVIPIQGGIYPIKSQTQTKLSEKNLDTSKEWFCPSQKTAGVPNGADLLIYTTVNKHCDNNSNTLASSMACERDQFDRPISGTIDFCLDGIHGVVSAENDKDFFDKGVKAVEDTVNSNTMRKNIAQRHSSDFMMNSIGKNWVKESNVTADKAQNKKLSKEQNDEAVERIVSIAVHEFVHILGMTSDSLSYFRHPISGEPLTPRPFTVSHVKCVDGREGGYLGLPPQSVMKESYGPSGMRHYEIVTPTVRQVVRNQFHCQELSGARLENQPTSSDCFGSHWDERLFFTETMGAIHSRTTNALSSLTLALLEDSGWYRANYNSPYVQPSTFGRGAGCDFVNKPCINDGKIPSYSKGSFCNSSMEIDIDGKITDPSKQSCSPDHTHKALCDLGDISNRHASDKPPNEFQYFENDPNLSPVFFKRADFCPVPFLSPLSCSHAQLPKIEDESFGPNSRCFETNHEYSLCLDTTCNSDLNKVQVNTQTRIISCDFDGQKHLILSNSRENDTKEVYFECPRFASICPHMVCPTNCAGKGICEYNDEKRQHLCSCFDAKDKTPGCTNSSLLDFSDLNQFRENSQSYGPYLNNYYQLTMLAIFLIISLLFFCWSRYTKAKKEKLSNFYQMSIVF